MTRLMKTPLQVLIMSIILERVGNLPPDRYQLFWRYYETVYDREAAKNTTLASLLTQHRRSITELHEAVGLTLQVRAEGSGDSRPSSRGGIYTAWQRRACWTSGTNRAQTPVR